MKLWYVNPIRKREVWTNKIKLFGFIPFKVRKAVYWDINAHTGMSWPLKLDRQTEPDFASLYQLVNNGWKREKE